MASTSYCNESSVQEFMYDSLKLYRAILTGKWETAKEIFDKNKDALTDKLDDTGDTALHIAILTCKNIGFVENLLKEIYPPGVLTTMVNKHRSTALHYAAFIGNTEAARMLVDKNKHLLFKTDNDGELPIHTAIVNSQKDTFNYMFHVSKQHVQLSKQEGYHNPFEGAYGAKLLAFVIREGMLDLACKLMDDYPDISTKSFTRGDGIVSSPIECMAEKADLYLSGTPYNPLQILLYPKIPLDYSGSHNTDTENPEMKMDTGVTRCRSRFHTVTQWIKVNIWRITLLVPLPCIKDLDKDRVKHNTSVTLLRRLCGAVKIKRHSDIPENYIKATYLAAENDIPEVVAGILKYFPQILWRDDGKPSVIALAISNRNEKVYNWLVHLTSTFNTFLLKNRTDNVNKNNLGHIVGKLAPTHKLNSQVQGATLQMHWEYQWFQEVQNLLHPADKEAKNEDDETPNEVFIREHKDLRTEGEAWIKKTAESYTIIAGLIITVAFAAAITVPGGINDKSRKAFFETNPCFIIYVVLNAVSLLTSTTSLLVFLSILTARYSEEDFLYKLPKRLLIGLMMLFLSVISMVVAFSAALFLLVGDGMEWILIPLSTLSCLPIKSKFHLLRDLIISLYGPGIFYNQNVKWYRKPVIWLISCVYLFYPPEESRQLIPYHLRKVTLRM